DLKVVSRYVLDGEEDGRDVHVLVVDRAVDHVFGDAVTVEDRRGHLRRGLRLIGQVLVDGVVEFVLCDQLQRSEIRILSTGDRNPAHQFLPVQRRYNAAG